MSGTSREQRFKRVGFISTRIAGTDGVSLEIEKWAEVLERNGYECFYFAGLCDRPAEKSLLVDEAYFGHPSIEAINGGCFGRHHRRPEVTHSVEEIKNHLKEKIYLFVKQFEIDVIIVENALAIPMNIPLGLALTQFIAETCFPTIAHHHDFYWERERFLVSSAGDYLTCAFPPDLHNMCHVVINSIASAQLSHRQGISNTLIPNVYNYASLAAPAGDYVSELREQIGLGENDPFILQPTRVVPRKLIERSIEIVSLMELENPVLVISHASRDEGDHYYQRILEYSEHWGVQIRAIEHLVGAHRGKGPNGEKIYSIGDVYQCADLVTYPSGYEGFGNAFLETLYYRRPIVVNRYSIYIVDIEPKGFQVITIDGFASREAVRNIREVLENEKLRKQTAQKNYELALQHYSYEVLERDLLNLLYQLSQQICT
ncbi:MAG: glycosyltransferase family 4 protein [Acidobacteria bacterium]|nr:glycosyltransferase family 4 protein [Acidobacteriota bacterium]